MSYASHLRCFACAAEQAPESGSLCTRCGGNLELIYDWDAVARSLNRASLAAQPERSILRYLPLLPVTDAALYPPLPVGWSPLLEPARLRRRLGTPALYLKDDSRNPSASFKDRASAVALAHARSLGAARICAASTGNAGSSMACLAAASGQPCVVLVPRSAPRAKVAQLRIFGAQVLAVEGSYDDAFDLSLELSASQGWYNRNTGSNPFTREGKKTCSFEICEQLGWDPPEWILVPVGDGNILSGIWKGLRDLAACGLIERLPRLVAVQSSASDAVVRSCEALGGSTPPEWSQVAVAQVEATTLADSISVDLPRDGLAAVRAVVESGGLALRVDDEEILQGMATLARDAGVFAEPAGAAAFAGLQRLLAQGRIDPAARTVVMVTGNGLKDVASALRAAGEPPVIEPHLGAALAALGL